MLLPLNADFSLYDFTASTIMTFLGIGAIVCLHWIMFYTSIKLGQLTALICLQVFIANSSLFKGGHIVIVDPPLVVVFH